MRAIFSLESKKNETGIFLVYLLICQCPVSVVYDRLRASILKVVGSLNKCRGD